MSVSPKVVILGHCCECKVGMRLCDSLSCRSVHRHVLQHHDIDSTSVFRHGLAQSVDEAAVCPIHFEGDVNYTKDRQCHNMPTTLTGDSRPDSSDVVQSQD